MRIASGKTGSPIAATCLRRNGRDHCRCDRRFPARLPSRNPSSCLLAPLKTAEPWILPRPIPYPGYRSRIIWQTNGAANRRRFAISQGPAARSYLTSCTCSLTSGPVSAFDTGHFFFASSACFCRSVSVRFGTCACVFSSTIVIVGPAPRVHLGGGGDPLRHEAGAGQQGWPGTWRNSRHEPRRSVPRDSCRGRFRSARHR